MTEDTVQATPELSIGKKIGAGVVLLVLAIAALWSVIDSPPAELPNCDDTAALQVVTNLLEPEYAAINGTVRITALLDGQQIREGINVCQARIAVVANNNVITQRIVSFITYIDEDGDAAVEIRN